MFTLKEGGTIVAPSCTFSGPGASTAEAIKVGWPQNTVQRRIARNRSIEPPTPWDYRQRSRVDFSLNR